MVGEHALSSDTKLGSPEVEESEGEVRAQLLKSAAVAGMSTLVNVGIGIVRTKAMAVILGPAGFGLLGLYTSIVDLAATFAGLGVLSSGVRQVADASASGRFERIELTVTVLRWISFILGAAGAIILSSLAGPASTFTFGNESYAKGVALVSLVVFFRVVSGGQTALLQGLRRISDIARINIVGALLATTVSIPIVYALGEQGVAPSLVAVAAMTTLTSWWFSRKARVNHVATVSFSDAWREAAALVRLGFAFMASSLFTIGAAYAVRLILTREVSLEAAGLYSSSWTLGSLYVGYVLQAMGADFYPRLVGLANDNDRSNRLVNDQTRIGVLIAGPGIIATLTLSPLVLTLLYSAKFIGAVDVLRWICLGMALRVITWPMGYVIIAKNHQLLFFCSDLAWTIVNVSLTWQCVERFGLTGAGIAFFGSYVFHCAITYPIVRALSAFRWSPATLSTIFVFVISISVAFWTCYAIASPWREALGVALTVASTIYSVRSLLTLLPTTPMPPRIKQIFVFLKLVPRSTE